MKCLSLWQPWASLVILAYKRFETRSWDTRCRGPLVIHASKHVQDVEYWFKQPYFREAFAQAGIKSFVDLPFGKALGVVELIETHRTDMIRGNLSRRELAFGNYEDGRYAWRFAGIQRFVQPLAMRGAQGLFECNITKPELYLATAD